MSRIRVIYTWSTMRYLPLEWLRLLFALHAI
jgi:hypothetical protein